MNRRFAMQFRRPCILVLALGLATWSTGALADYTVTCESRDSNYKTCTLDQAGYVTLERQLSSSRCKQGRDWDYDRREIWVDDGCRAEFKVHTYGYDNSHQSSKHHDSDDNHDAKVAAGVLVGAAILGALAHNANKDDARYRDDNYQGARHSSYVPSWMVGTFTGYNAMYDASVRMTINSDGTMTAVADGGNLQGWVNGGELHVGHDVFTIRQSHDGFVTSQVGDGRNEVHYHRIR